MPGAMGGFLAGSIVAKMLLDKTGWNSSVSSIQGDVKHLQVQTSTLGESVANMAKTWGLAGIAIVGTIGSMIMKNAEYMDTLDEMSTRTGVSVEDLSSYKLALETSGSSLDVFALGMKGLAGKMADARNGNQAAIKTFDDLGISFQTASGALRPLNDVFLDMADRFKQMGDTPERAALAVDALGRSGMSLIPTLDLGKAGLQRWIDKARELNLVVSEDSARSASDFKDRMAELKGAFDGVVQKIVVELLPTLTRLVERFVPVIEKIMNFIEKTKAVPTEIDAFAMKLEGLAAAFDFVYTAMGRVTWSLGSMAFNTARIETNAVGDSVGGFADKLYELTKPLTLTRDQLDEYEKIIYMATGRVGSFVNITYEATKAMGGFKNSVTAILPPLEDLAAKQKYSNLILDPAPGKVRNLGDALTRFAPLVDDVAYATNNLATATDTALTAAEQSWLNFKQNVSQGISDIVVECFKIPKGFDDALDELPDILGETIKVIYRAFSEFISQLIAKWVTDLLTDTIIKQTAAAATTAAGSLATLETGVAVLGTTIATFITTLATGLATALVTIATGIATSAAIIAAAAPEILIAGAVAAAVYGMFAGVAALFGGGGGGNDDITYWLKMIKDLDQEIHDVMVLNYLDMFESWNNLFESDNYCLYELHGRLVETRDAISYWGQAICDSINHIPHAQAGATFMSPTLAFLGEQAPGIPEIAMPEPVYERNLQMAAAMGGGQPGRPIELYINGEPVKFPLKENMRKIMIDLVPYMTKNEQLKIHTRAVRAF